MRTGLVRRVGVVGCGAGLLVLGACAPAGRLRTDFQEVDLRGAESVRTMIRMGAGELRLSGGASKLAEASFRYNVASWKPRVNYDRTGSVGRLTIRQNHGTTVFAGNVKNEWDVRLNNDVAMELEVALGAGESRLDLAGMSLRRLEIEMGVGQLTLDLNGPWKRDVDVRIRGGVGEAKVRLPRDVGVKVDAQGGLGSISVHGLRKRDGSYVNDAYGESKATLRLDIKGGIGEINLIAEERPRV